MLQDAGQLSGIFFINENARVRFPYKSIYIYHSVCSK